MEIPLAQVPGSVVGNSCVQLFNMLILLYNTNTDENSLDSYSFHEKGNGRALDCVVWPKENLENRNTVHYTMSLCVTIVMLRWGRYGYTYFEFPVRKVVCAKYIYSLMFAI
jgi:hypothetical protein